MHIFALDMNSQNEPTAFLGSNKKQNQWQKKLQAKVLQAKHQRCYGTNEPVMTAKVQPAVRCRKGRRRNKISNLLSKRNKITKIKRPIP